MKVNKKTMMFEKLEVEDMVELHTLCNSIITDGKVDMDNPYVVTWMQDCKIKNESKLVFYSTVMVQKMLLSVLNRLSTLRIENLDGWTAEEVHSFFRENLRMKEIEEKTPLSRAYDVIFGEEE